MSCGIGINSHNNLHNTQIRTIFVVNIINMETVYKGWQYINALFNYLYKEAQIYRTGHLVAPRFVFRGITQRHFTSSYKIKNFLKGNRSEFEKQKEYVENKERRTIEDNPVSEIDWLKIQKSFYTESKHSLNAYITNLFETDTIPDILLQKIVEHESYQYIAPLYIRSGAAVRLYCQQNRTQNDYVNYLRNLISESKSRYPEAYKDYSDLEILADI